MDRSLAEKLEGRLAAPDENGCRMWMGQRVAQGRTNAGGYGCVKHNGRRLRVPRAVWEAHYGAIPDGLVVRHKCDNPPCGELTHLELGSSADNTRDRTLRGRSAYGERSGTAKLTAAQVKVIRSEVAAGAVQAEVARRLGVTPQAVNLVIKRRNWVHVN